MAASLNEDTGSRRAVGRPGHGEWVRHSDATPTATNHEQIETATACLVQWERVAVACSPLRSDPRLEWAARAHTDDMRAPGCFSPPRVPIARHGETA